MINRKQRRAAVILPAKIEFLETRRLLSAATNTVLVPSASSIIFGDSVTFTATVTSHSATPTGSVTFKNGSTILDTETLAGSTATFTTTSLPSGTDNIQAFFSSTSGFSTSNSSTVHEAVAPIGTTLSLTASATPVTFTQIVTLTAAITASSGSPGGIVIFTEQNSTLGSAEINTGTGDATLTGTLHLIGTNDIKATYRGTNGYSGSISNIVAEVMNAEPTFTTLTSNTNPGTFGQLITYTATVTATSGMPSGNVVFLDGTHTLGKQSVNTHAGTANLATTSTSVGDENITAVFVPTTVSFSGSTSAPFSETINPESTTTTLTSSANPGTFGQTINFTADVTAHIGSPTGTVNFLDGINVIGTETINSGSHQAKFSTVLELGSHSITAVYQSSTDFAASSSAPISLTVNPVVTTTNLSASTTNPANGQGVTLTATVTGKSGSPSGNVTFLDGATTLGIVAVSGSGNSLKAKLPTATLPLGANSIVADYSGATGFDASDSQTVNVMVNPASTHTSLNIQPNPVVFGDTAVLTASVTCSTGSPGGTVFFLESGVTLGMATVDTTTHTAVFDDAALPVGNDNINAVYTGATGFNGSSGQKSVTVNGIPTTLALATSSTSAIVGEPITLTATVTSTGGTPSGSVTFLQGGTTLGAASINTSTNKAIFTTALLPVGMEHVHAVYAAQNGFKSSSSSPVPEDITPVVTTTTVTDNSVGLGGTVGTLVTFTATVTNDSGFGGVPSGEVVFTSGAATLGMVALNSSGQATISEFEGSYNIQANFIANSTFAGSQNSDTLTAALPSLALVDGLHDAVLTPGTGPGAAANGFVAVNYTGYLTDGTTLFDSSTNPDRLPDAFQLGVASNITAFNEIIPGMQVGEVLVMDVPSSLAFGSTGLGVVPPNAEVIFVVQMVDLSPAHLTVTNTDGNMVGNNENPSPDNGTDFGDVIVNHQSSVETFVLGNADSTGYNLSLFGNLVGAAFNLTGDTSDFSFSPTGSIGGDITVQFRPQSAGTKTLTIQVKSNDSNVPTFTFTVTGVGV